MIVKNLIIALIALVLLCLLGPIVIGILSVLVTIAPYLLLGIVIWGLVVLFCK